MNELFIATGLYFCSGFVKNFLMGVLSEIINDSYKLICRGSLETFGHFLKNPEWRHKVAGERLSRRHPGSQMSGFSHVRSLYYVS